MTPSAELVQPHSALSTHHLRLSHAPLPAPGMHAGGLRVIIAYKVVKGSLEVAVASALTLLILAHATTPLQTVGSALPHYFAGDWGVAAAKLLVSAAQPSHLVTLATVLMLDGLLTLVEGWALHRRHWWGAWLVVFATSSLLPFEIIGLVRHMHIARIVVLAVNLAVVAYLLRERHRAREASLGAEG